MDEWATDPIPTKHGTGEPIWLVVQMCLVAFAAFGAVGYLIGWNAGVAESVVGANLLPSVLTTALGIVGVLVGHKAQTATETTTHRANQIARFVPALRTWSAIGFVSAGIVIFSAAWIWGTQNGIAQRTAETGSLYDMAIQMAPEIDRLETSKYRMSFTTDVRSSLVRLRMAMQAANWSDTDIRVYMADVIVPMIRENPDKLHTKIDDERERTLPRITLARREPPTTANNPIDLFSGSGAVTPRSSSSPSPSLTTPAQRPPVSKGKF